MQKSVGLDLQLLCGQTDLQCEELVACIQHCEGRWLQTLWREQDRPGKASNPHAALESSIREPLNQYEPIC